jgi:hypothetical protein
MWYSVRVEYQPLVELRRFIQKFQAKIVTADIVILELRYSGITQWAEACRVFLVLEGSFKPLSIHLPGANDHPRDPEASDRPYQLCPRSFAMGGNTDIKTFAESDVVPGVMKFVFEVDQIDVHLHGCLQTKKGCSYEQPFSLKQCALFFLIVSVYRQTCTSPIRKPISVFNLVNGDMI